MSRNQLQDLPLHVFFGTVYLEILKHVAEQVAGLASARLLRHGLFGDPEHVAEPVAGRAPLHVFFGTVYLEILNMSHNRLQDLPLHVFYGPVYLEILNMSQKPVAGLASARLFRHGLFGHLEHVVEQLAGS